MSTKCFYCGRHTSLMVLIKLDKDRWYCSKCFKEMVPSTPKKGSSPPPEGSPTPPIKEEVGR